MTSLNSKIGHLTEILRGFPNVLVAYSGGVDSTLLLKVASDALGENARGIIGVSPSLPQRELHEAIRVAKDHNWRYDTIETSELADPNYHLNPHNRCYFCKKELFSEIYGYARQHGFQVIADGTNADDVGGHRPGMVAAEELAVYSPLKDAGLSKEDVRAISKELDLPTWNKPEMACLASRFPTGIAISQEKLSQVEQAEAFLKALGFQQVRVRHHEDVARIEVGEIEMERLFEGNLRRQIDARFKTLGYKFVAMDLSGYRRGSLSEGLPETSLDVTGKHKEK